MNEVVNQAYLALEESGKVYQFGNILLHPVNNDELDLVPLKRESLHVLLSEHAKFVRRVEEDNWKLVRPDIRLLDAMLQYPDRPMIRKIELRCDFPIILPDGKIAEPGYIRYYKVIVKASDISLDIPKNPTLDDARRAVDELSAVVADFPFVNEAHRSVFLPRY
ncbi:MAG: hypothetical protein RMJ19_07020 [Gemmatales bacterium]|nr:hypothetical protein [Gemmatales bacterium]MDW8175405.1 hypothetical protein [Gemmatales bacterium]